MEVPAEVHLLSVSVSAPLSPFLPLSPALFVRSRTLSLAPTVVCPMWSQLVGVPLAGFQGPPPHLSFVTWVL